MALEQLHELRDKLSDSTLDLHRALASLIEELEAVAWYSQRAEACHDEELRRVLQHNADEEKEHAAMLLEWLRRHDQSFAKELQDNLFKQGKIARAED